MITRRYLLFFVMIFAACSAEDTTFFDENDCWYDHEPFMSATILLQDFARFGKNLFSGRAFGVIAPFVPLWGASFMIDDRIHARHYCGLHHYNKRYPSQTLLDMSECLVGITIGVCAACSFAVKDRRLQRTGLLYAVTLPLTWAAKSLVKQIRWKCNLRPPHAGYKKNRCYYGGFPSGHMLEMTYAAWLFGLSIGPHFGIPIAISTGVIAAAFVESNRHYVSQLIAGAGIGTVLGCAAYWAISSVAEQAPLTIGFSSDPDTGGFMMSARCEF